MDKLVFTRNCPKCGAVLNYKNKNSLRNAINKNSVCKKCVIYPTRSFINEIGNRYGELTVIKQAGKNKSGDFLWLCKCSCGRTVKRIGVNLRRFKDKQHSSCGYCGKFAPGASALNVYYEDYKRSAEKRKIQFDLTIDEFKEIISKNCIYCEKEPSVKHQKIKGGIVANGIDRVNNKIGYIINNCVPCCSKCNYGKWHYSKHEFLSWIKDVYEHNFKDS